MSPETLQVLGLALAALLGGGIFQALVSFSRNRQMGKLEAIQFEFTTIKEVNDHLREDLAAVRTELAGVRAELAEERSNRKAREDDLYQAHRRITELEARMSGQEKRIDG